MRPMNAKEQLQLEVEKAEVSHAAAKKADDAAATEQARVEAAYDGSDRARKAVEGADRHRRFTALDLKNAATLLEAATKAKRDAEWAELEAERAQLFAETREGEYHRLIADHVEEVRVIDRELCARHRALLGALSTFDRKLRRLQWVEEAMAPPGREIRDRRETKSMAELALMVNALISADRRTRGDATPSEDPGKPMPPAALPESLLKSMRRPGFTEIDFENATKAAARYTQNTTAKAEKAA